MNKKIAFFVVSAGLFVLATGAFAAGVQIENPLSGVNNFCDLFKKIGDAIALIIGALGTLMLIIAAIRFLTSAGSPEKLTGAKHALFYAIAGIILALAAGAIVNAIIIAINAAGGQCPI